MGNIYGHVKKKNETAHVIASQGCFLYPWQESQSILDTNMKTFDKILSYCFGKNRCWYKSFTLGLKSNRGILRQDFSWFVSGHDVGAIFTTEKYVLFLTDIWNGLNCKFEGNLRPSFKKMVCCPCCLLLRNVIRSSVPDEIVLTL